MWISWRGHLIELLLILLMIPRNFTFRSFWVDLLFAFCRHIEFNIVLKCNPLRLLCHTCSPFLMLRRRDSRSNFPSYLWGPCAGLVWIQPFFRMLFLFLDIIFFARFPKLIRYCLFISYTGILDPPVEQFHPAQIDRTTPPSLLLDSEMPFFLYQEVALFLFPMLRTWCQSILLPVFFKVVSCFWNFNLLVLTYTKSNLKSRIPCRWKAHIFALYSIGLTISRGLCRKLYKMVLHGHLWALGSRKYQSKSCFFDKKIVNVLRSTSYENRRS